jgi:hypothetical protein
MKQHLELRIVEVEEQREFSQESIEQLTEVNKEILDEYLLNPTKLITMTKISSRRQTRVKARSLHKNM